jgi:hypothetical protein
MYSQRQDCTSKPAYAHTVSLSVTDTLMRVLAWFPEHHGAIALDANQVPDEWTVWLPRRAALPMQQRPPDTARIMSKQPADGARDRT